MKLPIFCLGVFLKVISSMTFSGDAANSEVCSFYPYEYCGAAPHHVLTTDMPGNSAQLLQLCPNLRRKLECLHNYDEACSNLSTEDLKALRRPTSYMTLLKFLHKICNNTDVLFRELHGSLPCLKLRVEWRNSLCSRNRTILKMEYENYLDEMTIQGRNVSYSKIGCMEDLYTIACVLLNIRNECGIRAFNAAKETLILTQILPHRCDNGLLINVAEDLRNMTWNVLDESMKRLMTGNSSDCSVHPYAWCEASPEYIINTMLPRNQDELLELCSILRKKLRCLSGYINSCKVSTGIYGEVAEPPIDYPAVSNVLRRACNTNDTLFRDLDGRLNCIRSRVQSKDYVCYMNRTQLKVDYENHLDQLVLNGTQVRYSKIGCMEDLYTVVCVLLDVNRECRTAAYIAARDIVYSSRIRPHRCSMDVIPEVVEDIQSLASEILQPLVIKIMKRILDGT